MANPAITAGEGNRTATSAVSGVVVGLAIISVALRIFTRFFTKAGLGWDDGFILLAMLSGLATIALVLWATYVDPQGSSVSGADPGFRDNAEHTFYFEVNFITAVLYFTITSSAKLSIVLMYNRLFSVSASFRRQVFVVAGLVVGFWIGCTVATLTNCVPLDRSWKHGPDNPRYCFNYNIFWMASGIVEALIDVLIIAMPVRTVLRLKMNTRSKVTVAAVFALGAL